MPDSRTRPLQAAATGCGRRTRILHAVKMPASLLRRLCGVVTEVRASADERARKGARVNAGGTAMGRVSRRQFLQLSAMTGGALLLSDWTDRFLGLPFPSSLANAAEPIKIGILDPLSSPYKTSSIHDVHGANVAVDFFNKRGGVLGRPVIILEADDASLPETALKAATKLVQEDRVDVLMGTFNADCALVVSEFAKKENKLFLVTGAHLPELTGGRVTHTLLCSCRTPRCWRRRSFLIGSRFSVLAGVWSQPVRWMGRPWRRRLLRPARRMESNLWVKC